MKHRSTSLSALARDLPGLCIILQSIAAVAIAGFVTYLFITSELL
jgi:hypothetical protein